ncbi:hypothetical protein T03_11577 [Trichinella britovi]|uniref:Uncharacterized protein n=2 Tax=Trichinella TaxID=6333 RepID=A0A0V1C3R0_TRIBR|nr:hypothetical protein T05_13044 [Trichinella murrelli]KRY43777.1 hypothetical protein T03_13074 [Trichinella britovi]KRY44801.1 hypothetical protein T03_11577 [Trichinella britovi]
MDQGKRSHAFHRMKRVGQECLKFPSFSLEPHQPQQYWQGGLTSWQCRKNCESRRKRKEKANQLQQISTSGERKENAAARTKSG